MQFIDLKKQQKTIRQKIDERIISVLDHGKYIMGPEVFELEEKLAEYVGVKHCISCSSGTDALLIPLMAKDVGPGDAVITTPFTYVATAEVIALTGATPVFCDIYPTTFNIDPTKIDDAVEYAISNGLSPKGIIPVDLFGLPARYRLVNEKAKEHNLFILEDAAQGFGGNIRGKKAGSFGDVSATSFFPAKPLGCYGDGGAIFTNDDDLASDMRSIRVHGGGKDKYDNVKIGLNGRLDTIQAAILLEKLAVFESELKLREDVANNYKNNLPKSFIIPYTPKEYFSSWAQFSILPPNDLDRETVMESLKLKSIPTMIYYKKCLHIQKGYEKYGYSLGDFPVAEEISKSIFSLPMHPYLNKEDQNNIIKALQFYE